VQLKQLRLRNCQEVIGIVDASKWGGEVSVISFASVDQVHRIITDTAAPTEMVRALHNLRFDSAVPGERVFQS